MFFRFNWRHTTGASSDIDQRARHGAWSRLRATIFGSLMLAPVLAASLALGEEAAVSTLEPVIPEVVVLPIDWSEAEKEFDVFAGENGALPADIVAEVRQTRVPVLFVADRRKDLSNRTARFRRTGAGYFAADFSNSEYEVHVSGTDRVYRVELSEKQIRSRIVNGASPVAISEVRGGLAAQFHRFGAHYQVEVLCKQGSNCINEDGLRRIVDDLVVVGGARIRE